MCVTVSIQSAGGEEREKPRNSEIVREYDCVDYQPNDSSSPLFVVYSTFDCMKDASTYAPMAIKNSSPNIDADSTKKKGGLLGPTVISKMMPINPQMSETVPCLLRLASSV